MGPARIAPQIRPIGLRRIGPVGARPGDRLAPRGDDGADASGEGIAGIGGEEILIARHGVAFERCGIGILHTEIADRLAPDRGDLVRRRLRGRVRPTIEKHERRVDLFGVPWHLCAFAGVVDAQPHAVEHLRQRQPAGTDHLGERLGVNAVIPLIVGCDGARCRVERDQHMRIRLDQCEAAGDRLATLDKGLLARRIQNDD